MALKICVPAHPGAVSLGQELWQEALWPPFCGKLERMAQMVPPGSVHPREQKPSLQICKGHVPQVSVVFTLA